MIILYHERDGLRVSAWKRDRSIAAPGTKDLVSYVFGKTKPNYPMPAIVACQWCGSRNDYCDYNGDGYWCPSLCFELN